MSFVRVAGNLWLLAILVAVSSAQRGQDQTQQQPTLAIFDKLGWQLDYQIFNKEPKSWTETQKKTVVFTLIVVGSLLYLNASKLVVLAAAVICFGLKSVGLPHAVGLSLAAYGWLRGKTVYLAAGLVLTYGLLMGWTLQSLV